MRKTLNKHKGEYVNYEEVSN